jgi:hypothetical protein
MCPGYTATSQLGAGIALLLVVGALAEIPQTFTDESRIQHSSLYLEGTGAYDP